MPAAMPSISVCPRYRRRLGGMWPLTPLARAHKICLPREKNHSGMIPKPTVLAPNPASYSSLEERGASEKCGSSYDLVPGYRRRPAQRRVGSYRPQKSGQAFQAGMGRDGGTASPDLRNPRGGEAHFRGISRTGGLLPKAALHTRSVSTLYVRAIGIFPRHD